MRLFLSNLFIFLIFIARKCLIANSNNTNKTKLTTTTKKNREKEKEECAKPYTFYSTNKVADHAFEL